MTYYYQLMETSRKLDSLIFLRGVAVLLVCFCHFGLCVVNVRYTQFALQVGALGVDVFFVISGFIIPLSMDRAGYELKNYFSFLFKRAVRLHPPYLVSLLLTFVISYAATAVKHVPFAESPHNMFLSAFYLYLPQENLVYWTLKVEVLYYLFIGIYFVALQKQPIYTMLISIPVIMLLSRLPGVGAQTFLGSLPTFLVGILGYKIYTKTGSVYVERACLVALLIFIFVYHNIYSGIITTGTLGTILYYHGAIHKLFSVLGEVSYSIYLIHYPIGVKIINLAVLHGYQKYRWLAFFIALGIVLVVSYVFWRLIERPFAKLSNRIRYGSKAAPKIMPLS